MLWGLFDRIKERSATKRAREEALRQQERDAKERRVYRQDWERVEPCLRSALQDLLERTTGTYDAGASLDTLFESHSKYHDGQKEGRVEFRGFSFYPANERILSAQFYDNPRAGMYFLEGRDSTLRSSTDFHNGKFLVNARHHFDVVDADGVHGVEGEFEYRINGGAAKFVKTIYFLPFDEIVDGRLRFKGESSNFCFSVENKNHKTYHVWRE